MPPLLGQMRVCTNRKMDMHVECAPPPPFGLEVGVVVRKRNGLIGEALFLTTSHLVVLVIYKCGRKENKHSLFYAPPFVNPGSTTDHTHNIHSLEIVVQHF